MFTIFKYIIIFILFMFGLFWLQKQGFDTANVFKNGVNNIKNFIIDAKNATSTDRTFLFDDLLKTDFIGNLNKSSIINSGTTTIKTIATSSIATTSIKVKASSTDEDGLTIDGIIYHTNLARKKAGLIPLKKNNKLNISAKVKSDDMLEGQYFDHDSPDGITASDLAKEAGYNFKLVGENLALGDFGNSKKVVEAWMNSKGHKANILNPKFTEIGIGITVGKYKGEYTWLAVQHFAKPLPICEPVDNASRKHIDNEKADLEIEESDLKKIADNIEMNPNQSQNFIDEYNTRVAMYNDSLANLREQISTFNKLVENYNICINK